MTAWHDPFGERIKANVRQCDKCGTELDEGDNAYFTGLDMLCWTVQRQRPEHKQSRIPWKQYKRGFMRWNSAD